MAISWTPPTTDLQYYDLNEEVTVVRVDPDGGTTTYTGVRAVADPSVPETPADAGGMRVTPGKTDWFLENAGLPSGVRPDRGWRVVSTSSYNGGTWLIQQVEAGLFGVVWICRDTIRLDQ